MMDGPPDGSETLPVPAPDLRPVPEGVDAPGGLTPLERDYLMVALFVRVQHQRHDEALTLIRAMTAAGVVSADLLFARAVVENALGDHEAALTTVRALERLSPATITTHSKVTRRVRMRAYIKARATFALTGRLDDEGRAALDFYLRHGSREKPARQGARAAARR